jgi:deoxyribodipyrimidine photo-lyase
MMGASSSSRGPVSIVWFRNDLRIHDQAALSAAAASGPVLPVYIWSPEDEGSWPLGAASRWWLHHSLASLAAVLQARSTPLHITTGTAVQALRSLARATGARFVHFTRRYEPAARLVEEAVCQALAEDGVQAIAHGGYLVWEPDSVRTQTGNPYQVFTPFYKACLNLPAPGAPLPAPRLVAYDTSLDGGAVPLPEATPLDALQLLPRLDWAREFYEHWTPGEPGGRQLLAAFARSPRADDYPTARDLCGRDGTSQISPHLHFGEISPRQVWAATLGFAPARHDGRHQFLRQLVWRDFAHHLLWHFPHTQERALRSEYDRFAWEPDPGLLGAWQRGQTGYPTVDAGMAQLWRTGWMHNRIRMVVASLLVKHLLQPWQDGARWFWDTLVDANLANNSLGWQWTAGCGADAAPYFRVFNPITQGEKFDSDGSYVRHWVPSLAGLPARDLHNPPALARRLAGYPDPVIEHTQGRARALEAYARFQGR